MEDKALEGLLMVVKTRCLEQIANYEHPKMTNEQVNQRDDLYYLLDTINHLVHDDDDYFLEDEDFRFERYDCKVPDHPRVRGVYSLVDETHERIASGVVISRTPHRAVILTGSQYAGRVCLDTDRGQRRTRLVHAGEKLGLLEVSNPPVLSYASTIADPRCVHVGTMVCHAINDGQKTRVGYARVTKKEGVIKTCNLPQEMQGGAALVYEKGESKLMGIIVEGSIVPVMSYLRGRR